jgi:N-formylglutamate amidohydrolase
MPASIRIGESGVRPDFIIGDRFGASISGMVVEHAIALLSGMGYTVAHNKPYAGGFITEHYGRPARRMHALQIEINRGLYMNERTFQKSAGFDALAKDITRFCADLMSLPDEAYAGLPLAAE